MSAPRYASLDVLRLIASFQMVQGHTLDALLANDLRQGTVFEFWSWVRGMTSLAFLFAAGGSLAVVHGRITGRETDGAAKRLRRACALIAIGYAMKIPVVPLLSGDFRAAWGAWVAVDILQCIGALLLGTELLRARASIRVVRGAVLALVVACLFAGRVHHVVATTVDAAGPFGILSAYVSGASRFPIVPYALPFVLGYASYAFLSKKFPARGRVRLGRTLEALAGETLVIYVFHVVLLYSDVVGLRSLIGPRLALGTSLGAAVLVAMSSVLVARAWHRGKRRGTIPEYL